MSVAKCAVHFLNSMNSSLMILYHATVFLLSCNALVVTLSLPLIFAAIVRRPEITRLYLSVPGTSLRPPLPSENLPTWYSWLSEPLSIWDVAVIQMCLCRHPRPSPYCIHTWHLTFSNYLLCKFPLCGHPQRMWCLSLPQPVIALWGTKYFPISSVWPKACSSSLRKCPV